MTFSRLAVALCLLVAGGCATSVEYAPPPEVVVVLADGLDPSRAPTFVSRDLAAARNALTNHPDAVPGAGMMIESRIPVSQFEAVLASLERPYGGFYPYGLSSTEITLRTLQHIELFNRYRVRL